MTRISGKFGRQPAKRLALRYIHEYAGVAPAALPLDETGGIPDDGWGMLGNDQYSNCTFAGETHYEMASAAAGHAKAGTMLTAQAEINAYLAYTHGQDVGAVLADVLLYWYNAGKIKAFAPVDHTNPAAVDAALATFHCVYVGVSLTDQDEQDFSNHVPWSSTTPNQNNGHCIVKVKSDDVHDGWVTWGALQESTKDWTKACVDEAWVIVTTEDLRATNIDLGALRADIAALGGTGGAVPAPPAPPAHHSSTVWGFLRRKWDDFECAVARWMYLYDPAAS